MQPAWAAPGRAVFSGLRVWLKVAGGHLGPSAPELWSSAGGGTDGTEESWRAAEPASGSSQWARPSVPLPPLVQCGQKDSLPLFLPPGRISQGF